MDEATDDIPAILKPAKPKSKPKAKAKPKSWVTAKALTSLRGVIPPGEPTTAKDYAGGKKTFDALCDKGLIVDGSP